jgi:hypothetical protein
VESIQNLCANNLATVNRYGNCKNNVEIKVTNVKYSIYIYCCGFSILHVLGERVKTTMDRLKRYMQLIATANGMVEGEYIVVNKIM